VNCRNLISKRGGCGSYKITLHIERTKTSVQNGTDLAVTTPRKKEDEKKSMQSIPGISKPSSGREIGGVHSLASSKKKKAPQKEISGDTETAGLNLKATKGFFRDQN